jgi:YggT family protein
VAGILKVLIDLIIYFISLILILHSLMSFAPLAPWHPVRRFIDQLAEPIVRPFRNLIPPVGMFDFSVLIALIAVQLVGQILVGIISVFK